MTRSRTIAFFPGSFKPPHPSHLDAVEHLGRLANVDEVRIVVSNRARTIPGTHAGLDAFAALEAWRILLGEQAENIAIELALGSAIEHVRATIARSSRRERLLFCAGEADLTRDPNRFESLTVAARERGVDHDVVQIPAAATPFRATDLRALIGRGAVGKPAFVGALEARLGAARAEQLWHVCQRARKPYARICEPKVAAAVASQGLPEGRLRIIDPEPTRLCYVLSAADGSDFVIKYAGDEIDHGGDRGTVGWRPRNRLAVERRTLRHLAAQRLPRVRLPVVECYDKTSRTLVLRSVSGVADKRQRSSTRVQTLALACDIARFLALLHTLPLPNEPLRGSTDEDFAWWASRLAVTDAASNRSPDCAGALAALTAAATAATQTMLLHGQPRLDAFTARGGELEVLDLTDVCSLGDPAYDLGRLIASACLAIGADSAISEIIDSYLRARTQSCPDSRLALRARGFAAAALLAGVDGQHVAPTLRASARLMIVDTRRSMIG